MGETNGKILEFFKVYLPDFSSNELMIPPSFIDILEKPLPNKTLLKDEIGRSWSVETRTQDTQEKNCVLFTKGWCIFAKDQSLEFGDFLVFRYDGDSIFYVKIFAKDGCRKDLCVVDERRTRVSFDKEPVIKPVNKPVCVEDCNNKVNLKRKRGLVDDEPEINVSTCKTEPEYIDSCNMSCVYEKKFKECEEPVYKPKNPHFVRTITSDSLHRMEIPVTLLKSNGIELEEDINLYDHNGKKWAMKTVKFDKGIKCEPWGCFTKSHNLMKKNKCLFEFIVANNGKCNEIHVRIFRGRLVTSITRSGYQVVAM
ncbi:unnamed protein product [Cochlearia groenlandica]